MALPEDNGMPEPDGEPPTSDTPGDDAAPPRRGAHLRVIK